MSCYHPLKAFPIGLTKNNKIEYKITNYETNHIELINNKWFPQYTPIISGIAVKHVQDYVEIPCGKCIGCRLDYSRQWANRCMLEAKEYGDDNYFVTVTYNDFSIPRVYYSDPDTGQAHEAFTLSKRDIQLFIKRLRRAYSEKYPDKKLRYFLAGEYGDSTKRPHYHLLLFNLHLDDLKVYKNTINGILYNSKFLDDCWFRCTASSQCKICDKDCDKRVSAGYVVVSPMTWETCAYTARYCMKKVNGVSKDFYDTFNLVPEFTLMSRKPGIGLSYFEHNKEHIYEFGRINISTDKRGIQFSPPRYFDNKYGEVYPELLEEIKARRKEVAIQQKEMRLSQTDLDYLEMLAVEEKEKKNKTQILFNRKEI